MTDRRRMGLEAVREHASATTLELFFDLVFVFALTQISALISADLTLHGALRGVLVLAIVWWCWVDYAWASNVVKADEGLSRVAMFAAMSAMFIIALAIPESFEDLPAGVSGPAAFALGYLALRAVHLGLFTVVSHGDPGLRRQVILFSFTMVGATSLLLIAAGTTGIVQTLLWVAAVLIDYGGTLAIGSSGWRLGSAKHFAERHGLIVIIALGESIVAIGVGVAQLPLSWPIIVAALLGLCIAASLWWAYFDTAALRAEHSLRRAEGHARVAMAQHAYTYLHLPMLLGIVLSAVGLKKVLEHAGDPAHHELSDPLTGSPTWALFAGISLFLLAHVAFGKRTYGEIDVPRTALAVLLLGLIGVAALLPAIASLGAVALLLAGLNVLESLRSPDARHEVRHRDPH